MTIQWSGLGPELLLRLDRGRGQPLRSQLETGLREAIRSGRLHGGERLPSSRELARELGVSRGLVQECYSQLLSEGYLISQAGSATRVAAGAYLAPPEPAQRPEHQADPLRESGAHDHLLGVGGRRAHPSQVPRDHPAQLGAAAGVPVVEVGGGHAAAGLPGRPDPVTSREAG